MPMLMMQAWKQELLAPDAPAATKEQVHEYEKNVLLCIFDELNSYDKATQDEIKVYILQNFMTMTLEDILAGVRDILDKSKE